MSQSNPAQGGGEAAYEALFRAHEASVYRLAFQICGDPRLSAEVVAEGFARAWPRWKAGGGPDLVTTVRKTIVKELNARLRSAKGQPTAAIGDDPVRRALASLPLRRRTVIVLRFQADLAAVDAAEASGLSLSIVKGETKKGIRQLRRALALPDAAKARPTPSPSPTPTPVPPVPPTVAPPPGHDVSWITSSEAQLEADSEPELWADDDRPPAEEPIGAPTVAPAPPPADPEADVTTYGIDLWPDIVDAEIVESPPKHAAGDAEP